MKAISASASPPEPVTKVWSLEQTVRGGSSSPSWTHSWKWYVVPGVSPLIGSETGCGWSSSIATVRCGVWVA